MTKASFRRPHRYEFIDGLNVKIQLTDKKLGWSRSNLAGFMVLISILRPEEHPYIVGSIIGT